MSDIQEPSGQATAPRKVLIVDDTFSSRQLLARMLNQVARLVIHEARDGDSAVAQYQRMRPQITFLDIDMPNKNGMDVLKEIRALDPSAYVVMVSAAGSIDTVQAALALGVGGFVVKPFSERRILDVMRKYAAECGDASLLVGA